MPGQGDTLTPRYGGALAGEKRERLGVVGSLVVVLPVPPRLLSPGSDKAALWEPRRADTDACLMPRQAQYETSHLGAPCSLPVVIRRAAHQEQKE